MTARRLIEAALLSACAVTGAHADTTDDLKNGSLLFMNYAHYTLDGQPSEAAVIPVSKPAGTLTFDIPASALGIPIANLSLHVVGSQLGNGQIQFNTSNTYNPPVAIDLNGTTLSSEYGSFTVTTWSVAGADAPSCGVQPCSGGTGYQILGGLMTVSGSFGVKIVNLDQVRGVGGVPRSAIGGLLPPPQHVNAKGSPELPFCSSTVTTHALLKIALGTPAPIGGARVDLTSSISGLRFSPSVLVPQGRDTALLDVSVPASFAGTLELDAAAGGQVSTGTLDVLSQSACVPPPRRRVLASIAGCAGCSAFGALNNEGDEIIAINGVIEFVHAGVYTELTKLLGASAVGADSVNDAGMIAGRFTRGGVTQAYRVDMSTGGHAPVLLGGMTPMAIAQDGVVVGYRVDQTTGYNVAVINHGFGVADLPLSSSYGIRSSRALFMTQSGTIVGTYTGTDGIVRGYRFSGGTTTTLASIAGSPAIPTGVAADGSIAVNAGTIAAVIAPNGAVTQYGAPSGYSEFVVKDINKWKYAVGIATCTTCGAAIQRAFVYVPGSGFTPLSGYVSSLAYADDALAINDDNQIAIHGELDTLGAVAPPADYYLLSL